MTDELARAIAEVEHDLTHPLDVRHDAGVEGKVPHALVRVETLRTLLAALSHPPQERTEQEIEAGARELFRIGNERIGERKWEDVGHYYMAEARACLSAVDKSSPQGTVRDPGAVEAREDDDLARFAGRIGVPCGSCGASVTFPSTRHVVQALIAVSRAAHAVYFETRTVASIRALGNSLDALTAALKEQRR